MIKSQGNARLMMKCFFGAIWALATVSWAGEVTEITHDLTGFNSFTNIRVFIDDCDQEDKNDFCDLEGDVYPCCHVNTTTPIKGYLTMLSEEGIDEISEGEVVCEGSGWNTPQPCIDSEFCNGVNTTCPLVGGTSVRFDFGMSTADWATFDVGSRVEKFELMGQDGTEMLSFSLDFQVQ